MLNVEEVRCYCAIEQVRNGKCLWKISLAAVGRGNLRGQNQGRETVAVFMLRLVVVLNKQN